MGQAGLRTISLKPTQSLTIELVKVQTSLLPGVFWVYELHPFEIHDDRTLGKVNGKGTLGYLIVRIMAVVGGVVTIVGWVGGWIDDIGKGMFKGVGMVNLKGGF